MNRKTTIKQKLRKGMFVSAPAAILGILQFLSNKKFVFTGYNSAGKFCNVVLFDLFKEFIT